MAAGDDRTDFMGSNKYIVNICMTKLPISSGKFEGKII